MLLQAGQKLAHWFLADLFNNFSKDASSEKIDVSSSSCVVTLHFHKSLIWGTKVNRPKTKQGFQAEVVLLGERRMNYYYIVVIYC